MINYYELLKVPDFSSFEKIKQNYKKLIIESHPDKGGDSSKFEQIREAYELMKDEYKKKEYDNKLIYYQEMFERAEEINIGKNETIFYCTQCAKKNEINPEIFTDSNKTQYIIKCEGCSMIYKININ